MKKENFSTEVSLLMQEGKIFLNKYNLEDLCPDYRARVLEASMEACELSEHAAHYGAACQSFLIFQILHDHVEENPELYTLLGDFFFSLFSGFLIPIDSTEIVLAFSAYLKNSLGKRQVSGEPFDIEDYCRFVKNTVQELKPDGE